MIEWITNWAQGIIIAVIIATIIEMILPNGSCKKYIKVVIGVYILFSIISPVISKITGKGFNISEELNLEEFYTEVDSKATANMYIVNPFKGERKKKQSNIWSTHPATEDRIEAIRNLK